MVYFDNKFKMVNQFNLALNWLKWPKKIGRLDASETTSLNWLF